MEKLILKCESSQRMKSVRLTNELVMVKVRANLPVILIEIFK